MSSRLYRKSLVGLIVVLLFFLAPAHAAPSLSVGTTAKYNVSIILHISNGCTADPVQYAGDACSPIVYYQPPYPVKINPLISIFDSGQCPLSPPSNVSCGFNPSYQMIYQGVSVTWINSGIL